MQTISSIAVDALAYGMVLFVDLDRPSVTLGLMRVVQSCPRRLCDDRRLYRIPMRSRDLGLGYGVAC